MHTRIGATDAHTHTSAFLQQASTSYVFSATFAHLPLLFDAIFVGRVLKPVFSATTRKQH